MKVWHAVLLFGFALSSGAAAQTVPRIKAKLLSIDGTLMSVDAGDAKPMTVGLLPATKIVKQEKRALTDIKAGDYVGATFITAKDGSRRAQEVHVLPDELRGSGEGIIAAGPNRFTIGGTVSAAAPGALTLQYHGSEGTDGSACTGRALPLPGGCQGSATIAVAPGVPLVGLVHGDKSLLVPGAVLAISVLAGPDGHPVTPGLTVEGMTPADAPKTPAAIAAPATPAKKAPQH
jgi:hypothetical protein